MTQRDQASRTFQELIWPQRARVLRVARLLVGDISEAEDLAQETLLKAFRGIESFRVGSDASAWLLTILRNLRVDRLRSRQAHEQTRTLSLDALEHDPADQPTDDSETWSDPEQVLNAFSDQHVIDALLALPEEIRMTLLLSDVEGLDQTDAAEILQIPVGTVKSRLHRGRAMLRTQLEGLAREMRLVK